MSKIIENLTELLSARYDPETDKIVGAKEGSLVWHHERGHRLQKESGLYQKLSLIDGQCLYLTIAALVLGLVSFAQIFFATSFIMRSYSEIGAWLHAFTSKN